MTDREKSRPVERVCSPVLKRISVVSGWRGARGISRRTRNVSGAPRPSATAEYARLLSSQGRGDARLRDPGRHAHGASSGVRRVVLAYHAHAARDVAPNCAGQLGLQSRRSSTATQFPRIRNQPSGGTVPSKQCRDQGDFLWRVSDLPKKVQW
jgi:hypothetical protein